MTLAPAEPIVRTALTGDGHNRWEAFAYVRPLNETAPPAPPGELGVLPHRWRGSDLARWSDPARPSGHSGAPLALINPGLGEPARTTRTLTAVAGSLPADAESDWDIEAAGLRVVLEGSAELATPIGAPLGLGPGDLILLDGMRAEDWRAGEEGVRWLDVVDFPLRSALGLLGASGGLCTRRQHHECTEAERAACRKVPRLRRWRRTERGLAEAAPRDGIRRVAPFAGGPTGGPSVDIDVEVLRLDPGPRTRTVEATCSAIGVALSGSGSTVVDGWRFDWTAGDVFVVPPEAPHDHLATAPADLLVVSDAPILRAIGALRARRCPDPQPIEHILE